MVRVRRLVGGCGGEIDVREERKLEFYKSFKHLDSSDCFKNLYCRSQNRRFLKGENGCNRKGANRGESRGLFISQLIVCSTCYTSPTPRLFSMFVYTPNSETAKQSIVHIVRRSCIEIRPHINNINHSSGNTY